MGCSLAIFHARCTEDDVDETNFRFAAGGGSEFLQREKKRIVYIQEIDAEILNEETAATPRLCPLVPKPEGVS